MAAGTGMYMLYMPNRHHTRAASTFIEFMLERARQVGSARRCGSVDGTGKPRSTRHSSPAIRERVCRVVAGTGLDPADGRFAVLARTSRPLTAVLAASGREVSALEEAATDLEAVARLVPATSTTGSVKVTDVHRAASDGSFPCRDYQSTAGPQCRHSLRLQRTTDTRTSHPPQRRSFDPPQQMLVRLPYRLVQRIGRQRQR